MTRAKTSESSPVVERVTGRAVPVRGDDIDTDRIIPARFLRCVTFHGIEEHAFEDERLSAPRDAPHPFDREEFQGARILIVNRNFGCGSSREHAPQALMRWGIAGLVGVSFAEIFFGNCVALGIPCLTVSPAGVEELQNQVEAEPKRELVLDVAKKIIQLGDRVVTGELPDGVGRSFLNGTWDATAVLLEGRDAASEVAARLPYVNGFA